MSESIHLTVAVVVERNQLDINSQAIDHSTANGGGDPVQYLMVREIRNGREVYNQPAGHVEPGETLLEAAIRETLEETAWRIKPTGVISFSTYTSNHNGITYYRLALAAKALEFEQLSEIDNDIEEALWMDYEQICSVKSQLRSPMVLQAIDDFRANRIYSLDLLKAHR